MIAHARTRTAARRNLAMLFAADALATSLSVMSAPAAEAQSYSCPQHGAQTIELNDGSASATIYVSKDC